MAYRVAVSAPVCLTPARHLLARIFEGLWLTRCADVPALGQLALHVHHDPVLPLPGLGFALRKVPFQRTCMGRKYAWRCHYNFSFVLALVCTGFLGLLLSSGDDGSTQGQGAGLAPCGSTPPYTGKDSFTELYQWTSCGFRQGPGGHPAFEVAPQPVRAGVSRGTHPDQSVESFCHCHAQDQPVVVVQLVPSLVQIQRGLLPGLRQGLGDGFFDLACYFDEKRAQVRGQPEMEPAEIAGQTAGSPGRPPQPPQPPHAQRHPQPPKPPAGKGKGKGKIKSPAELAAPPPPAPAAENTAESKLAEVLSALTLHREKLPEDLQALVQAQQVSDASAKAKALHKHVSAQTAHTKHLITLRSQRAEYQKSWHSYVQGMASRFNEQLEEQRKVLEDFAAREAFLEEAAKQARSQVLAIAGDEPPPESLLTEAAIEQSERDPWKALMPIDVKRAEETLASKLKKVAKKAKEALVEVKREGSRTPRRGDKRGAESISSSASDAPDEVMAPPVAPEASATPSVPSASAALQPFGLVPGSLTQVAKAQGPAPLVAGDKQSFT